MHRWTPVSSTVPSWSTSTSQEVFHVDTNLPANREFLICTLVDRAPTPFLWQPKPGFQLALLSLSQSRTLLLFLFGTPHHGPVQALFHCSNKCRLRELNGDLQTIASCSIGGQREREALLKTRPRWTDARKMYSGFSWMKHLGTGQCNSAAASCDKEELGCVLCGKPWQWEPQGGKDARCGGLVAAASLGRVGGRAGPATIHVRGQGHLARARDADGQLHTHHPPWPMCIWLHYSQKQCSKMRELLEGLVLSVKK